MRITRFEELAEKVVPWFIIAALVVILATLNGCKLNSDALNEEGIKSLKTFEIDGCEYLGSYLVTRNAMLTHKGNCKNPIHRCEKK